MNWSEVQNLAYLTIDLPSSLTPQQTALIWVGEDQKEQQFTYFQLAKSANRFANYLTRIGVHRNDRVFFFMPRWPFLYYAFQGTLKTGAIGGTLFAAFGTQALSDRLSNSQCRFLFTTPELYPRLKNIKTKLPHLEKIIVVDNQLIQTLDDQPDTFTNVPVLPEDPAFMLYTSATGITPVSGIVIPHQGIIQQIDSAKSVLKLKSDLRYWCTADPGWVTGVVYGLLTPFACQVTSLVYAARFEADKWLNLLNKYHLQVIYTAPTALRLIQKSNPKPMTFPDLKSIFVVGEALPIDLYDWAKDYFGIPPYDTYWQTETGSLMIANHTGMPLKKGSMGKNLPGITAAIVDHYGQILKDGQKGFLVFKPPWPSMMVKIWQNQPLYKSYFKHGWFYTGDQAYRDPHGYFWFIGRQSEIIKTSGERVGTFEVETVINQHLSVLESAVIGKPDPIRGEIIKAFIILKSDIKPDESLKSEIQSFVKTHLAGHAYPREIDFISQLPKNRSGKILRRMLKAKELGLPIGDTSTLDEES